MWAFYILKRFADLLGESEVKRRLSRKVKVFSFFSGMDCMKHAGGFIEAACLEMWGFRPGFEFSFPVVG